MREQELSLYKLRRDMFNKRSVEPMNRANKERKSETTTISHESIQSAAMQHSNNGKCWWVYQYIKAYARPYAVNKNC